MSNVRIVSNGTPQGTVIIIDGVARDDVVSASWSIDGFDRLAQATLVFENVELDVDMDDGAEVPPGREIVQQIRQYEKAMGH